MPDLSHHSLEITESRRSFFAPCPRIALTQYEGNKPPSINESSYPLVSDNSRQHERFTVSNPERFLDEIEFYRVVYEKLEVPRRRDLRLRLLDVGKQVRCGTRAWTRQHLDEISSWKGLPPPMLVTDKSALDFACRLDKALRIEDESSRVNALCDVRGIGPILASVVSMFTWPETCGFIDYHTSNALRFLGFEFPRKHYTSRFTIPQLLTYLRVIRSLGASKAVSAMEVAEALSVLDRAETRYGWNVI